MSFQCSLAGLPHLVRMSLWGGCFGCVQTGGGPKADPGHAGEIISPAWPGNGLVAPLEELEEVAGEREVWAPLTLMNGRS